MHGVRGKGWRSMCKNKLWLSVCGCFVGFILGGLILINLTEKEKFGVGLGLTFSV